MVVVLTQHSIPKKYLTRTHTTYSNDNFKKIGYSSYQGFLYLREDLRYVRRNCSVYNHFNKWSVTKSGFFFPKWSIFFFRINFPSSHLSVCCGYLIESGAFEIFLPVMLMQIADFVGQPYFLKIFGIFWNIIWNIS